MNRGDAYRVLAAELESFRQRGYDALLPIVGQTVERSARIGEEDIRIEIRLRWDDAQKRTIRVNAAALGPSSWALERLDESIILHP